MTNIRSSAWKRLLAVILSVAVVISMGAWSTAMVDAAAAPEVSVFLVGKDGQDKTLAQWNYDSENKTYTENGAALGIVKDFTSEENLAGEVNGKSYDFTDIGALPYTGINRKPDPRCLSVTTKGILLEDFYDYAEKKAGIDLRGDTMMYLSDSTGFNDTFTYDQYWGLDRYYYPDWYNAESYSAENMGNTERYVPTTLAVLGYHGTTGADLGTLISNADDFNSIRISSGMQKGGNKTIAEIEGTTYSMGDINEGMLSVKGISVFRFTPVYNTISVADSTTSGTEGTDLIAKTKHATISTGDNYFKAAKGEPVELTATADEGYSVSGVTVKDGDDKEINVTEDNGKWTFGMPAGAVTVSVDTQYDYNSAKWAGGLDFSWYDENDVKDEYHITTPEQWEAIAWICSEDLARLSDYEANTNGNVTDIKGDIPTRQNKFEGVQFYLDNDIDMGGVDNNGTWSGPNYYPIGSQGMRDTNGNFYGVFFGSFDGQGHYVKNVYANRGSGQSYQSVGLFGRIGAPDDDAVYPSCDITIENLGMTGYVAGGRSVGGMVGKTLHVANGNSIVIKNCMTNATVTSTDKKGLGGVCGALWNGASMENCYSLGEVSGSGSPKGGVVGDNESNVTNVYATQNIAPVAGKTTTAPKVTNAFSLSNMTLEEMMDPAFAKTLGEGFKAVCGGTPALAWEKVKEHQPGATVIENNVDVTYTQDGSYEEAVYCTECNIELSRDAVVVPALKNAAGDALAEAGKKAEAAKTSQDKAVESAKAAEEAAKKPGQAAVDAANKAKSDAQEAAKAAEEAAEAARSAEEAAKDAQAMAAAEEQTATDALKQSQENLKTAVAAKNALPADATEEQKAAAEKAVNDAMAENLIALSDASIAAKNMADADRAVNNATEARKTAEADAEKAQDAVKNADNAVKAAEEAAKKAAQKKAQPMNVKAKTKTFKAKKLKKKAKTFKAITVTNAKGKVTYAKISGSKKLNVNKKNGKLTIKKKTKKGLYKIKVRVNAAGDSQYKAGAKNVTVKVKVR